MDWKRLSYTKKGLLIGLMSGIIFGIYSNITSCHGSFGGSSGYCSNDIERFIATIEFFLFLGPYVLFQSIIPDTMFAGRVLYFISPVIIFSLTGLLIGMFVGKIKSKQ